MKIVNRDMSIAVLRAFATKRQEEHEENLAKKAARKNRVPAAVNGKDENGDAQEQSASTAEGEDSKPSVSGSEAKPEDEVLEMEKPETSPSEKIEEAAASVEPAVESKIAKPLHVLEVFLNESGVIIRLGVRFSFSNEHLLMVVDVVLVSLWSWWNAGLSRFRIEGTSVC